MVDVTMMAPGCVVGMMRHFLKLPSEGATVITDAPEGCQTEEWADGCGRVNEPRAMDAATRRLPAADCLLPTSFQRLGAK